MPTNSCTMKNKKGKEIRNSNRIKKVEVLGFESSTSGLLTFFLFCRLLTTGSLSLLILTASSFSEHGVV